MPQLGKTIQDASQKASQSVKKRVDPRALEAQTKGTTEPVGTSNNPSHRVFTLANVITFARLILTLVFLVMFVNHENRALALSFYVIAAVTDFLDGQIARRTQTVSWVGKIMDPIMDRVLLFTGVLGLILTRELPIWVAVVVIGRDIYLGIGSMILQKYRRRPIDVVYTGKISTALLMTGFSLMLLGLPLTPGLDLCDITWLYGLNGQAVPLGLWFVYAGLVFSITTAVIYTKQALSFMHEARELGHRVDE